MVQDSKTKARKRGIKNAKSLKHARNHRDEWTDAQMDQLMEDDPCYEALAISFGRTITAVQNKRRKLKEELVSELASFEFEHAALEESSLKRVEHDTKRTAVLLTAVWLDREPPPTEYDLMGLYSMLGLME